MWEKALRSVGSLSYKAALGSQGQSSRERKRFGKETSGSGLELKQEIGEEENKKEKGKKKRKKQQFLRYWKDAQSEIDLTAKMDFLFLLFFFFLFCVQFTRMRMRSSRCSLFLFSLHPFFFFLLIMASKDTFGWRPLILILTMLDNVYRERYIYKEEDFLDDRIRR